MNIHHLELFYYVARHGGISEAVRNIPYGIQQPAISGQIAQLEEFLGTTLFHRRPFALTPAGEKLYKFIEPFFSGVEAMTAELQGGTTHQLRIGSSDIVLRDHLPEVLQAVRKKFPQLKVTLREGYQPELEDMLERQEIDMAVTVTERKPIAGVRSLILLELPLILVVPVNSPITAAEQLWKRDKIHEPLICLPATEVMSRNFQQGLSKLGVDWFPSIEINSTDCIESYVANGFGIGLTVSIPKTKMSPKVRKVELPGFGPLLVGALWRGKPSPPLRTLLDELEARALRLKE
ncbi:MAG TPA: LysR family transcriptional regulator [Verrucomicrobiae bacterium]|jgi:DNA-binding transcriptional LysR family regulator|nr:LysR family transcriptional regulator [Verrucomicrobiae bacterium]